MNVIGNICSTWVGNEYIQQTFVNNKIVAFNSIGIWKMFPGGIELSPMHHTGKELNHSATRTLSRLLRHIRKDVTGALFQISTLFSAYLLPRKTEDCRPNRGKNGRLHFGGLLTQQELTPCEQGRRRESSSLPRFFWISFVKGDFEKRIFQFRVRACVRASVRPEAHSDRIGRFCLTKNGGF